MNRPTNFEFDVPDLKEKYKNMFIPDASEALEKYAAINPHGADIFRNEEAYKEWREMFYNGNKLRSAAGIQAHIRAAIISYLARAEQLNENALWQRQGNVPANDAQFESSRRDVFKTVSEVAVRVNDLMHERSAEDRQGFGLVDIKNLVLDPRKMSDTFLRNLGIDPPKGPKNKPMSYDKKIEMKKELIPAVKAALAQLQPFTLTGRKKDGGLTQFRLYRMGGGKNEGKVIGFQMGSGGTEVMFATDLQGALRRMNCIFFNYDEEVESLSRLEATFSRLRRTIAGSWQGRDKKTQIEDFNKQFEEIISELQLVRDEDKLALLNLARQSMDLKVVRTLPRKKKTNAPDEDMMNLPPLKIEQFNPGAVAATLGNAEKSINGRIVTMRAVMSHLSPDRVVTKKFVDAQSGTFDDFVATTEKDFNEYRLLKPKNIKPERAEKIRGKLEEIKKELEAKIMPADGKLPLFEPHLSMARKMVMHIESAIANLEEGKINQPEAANDFVRMYLVGKIARFQQRIAQWYDKFLSSRRKDIKVDAAILELDEIQEQLWKKTVSPGEVDITTTDYHLIFDDLYHLGNSMRTRLRQMPDADSKTVRKLRVEMENRFKNFDYRDLLFEPREPREKSGRKMPVQLPVA